MSNKRFSVVTTYVNLGDNTVRHYYAIRNNNTLNRGYWYLEVPTNFSETEYTTDNTLYTVLFEFDDISSIKDDFPEYFI